MRFPRVVWLAAAALLVPSVASAHLALRNTSPAADARLERAPDAITLRFTQRPQVGFSRLSLIGPSGAIVLGAITADTGNALRVSIPAVLGPGSYTVQWQTASADGHPLRGEFRFTIAGALPAKVDTTTAAPAPHVHEPAAELHREHAGYREVRFIEFAALLAILGVIGFQHLVLPALASRGVGTTDAFHRARRVGQMALPAYFLAAGVRLYAEWELMRTMTGDAGAIAQLRQIVAGTTWGWGWTLGVAGALVVLGGWRLAASRRAGSTTLAAIGGMAMAVSPALSGHAAAASPLALNVALDASHVLMAGFWIGSLFIMLVAGVPALLRGPDGTADVAIAALVNSFHPVALVAAPFVVLSGAGSAWLRLGAPANILGSAYGQILLIKVMLVLCVAVLGVHNSARARRRLGAPETTRTFRVTAWAEVAIAAVVLVVTTILIVTPIPAQPMFP
jgi:copper transport protein